MSLTPFGEAVFYTGAAVWLLGILALMYVALAWLEKRLVDLWERWGAP